jgi:hypothetical protein
MFSAEQMIRKSADKNPSVVMTLIKAAVLVVMHHGAAP